MDYNFVEPNDSVGNSGFDKKKVLNFVKKISPVMVVSAILPVFLFFLYNPPETTFAPQASASPELRIWFEPSSLVMSRGSSYDVGVYASIDQKSDFVVQRLSFDLDAPSGLIFGRGNYSFETPFAAEQMVGTISVNPTTEGEHIVSITEGSVDFEPFSADLEFSFGTLSIFVR